MSDSKSHRKYIASHLTDIPPSGIRDFFEIVSEREDVISLGIGEPDFVTPWHIRESSIFALNNGATSYTSNLGLLSLRREISKYVKKSYNIPYDADKEILVTVGVSEALDLAIRTLVEPGDEVLYHEPCYVSYAPVITMAYGVPVPITTKMEDGFTLTKEMLEEKVTDKTKVLIINFPTNPTGGTLSSKDAEGIAEFAIEHDIIVISDEIYSELTYEGERVSIASIPGMKDRTIFLNGFSKTWAMTGFRLGFSCAPPGLTDAMMKIHQYTMLCAPILSQEAALEALRNGDRDIAKMKTEYNRRRKFICSSLNEMGIPCHMPKGAFYVFPYIGNTGLSSKEFSLQLLEDENVACVPGNAFGESGEGFLRCSYATSMDEIKEAMFRMKRFVSKLPASTAK